MGLTLKTIRVMLSQKHEHSSQAYDVFGRISLSGAAMVVTDLFTGLIFARNEKKVDKEASLFFWVG